MRILFWKHSANLVSGSDHQLYCYAARLRAAGHEPIVLLLQSWLSPYEPYPAESREFGLPARLRALGVPVLNIVDRPLHRSLRALRKTLASLPAGLPRPAQLDAALSVEEITRWTVARLIRQLRPDLIHVLDPREGRSGVVRAAHEAGVPVIYHELRIPRDSPESSVWYEGIVESLALCTQVAALSPRHARICRERLGYHRPISILPVMVEPPVEPAISAHQKTRRAIGRVTFGYAGFLHRAKGLDVLLEAMALLLPRLPEARLRLAGCGPHQEDFEARAKALGIAHRCEFAGAYFGPEQLSAFMRSLDVFVLPSPAEGTPNSIAEAMAHGLPVVASDVGGIPDLVSPEAGVLVPAGDAAALSAALLEVGGDARRRAEMGEVARKKYDHFFSPEAVLPLLLDTYRQLAQGHEKSVSRSSGARFHPWAEKILHRRPEIGVK
jgi:glycosyltransferase involved in cell wall biosynthesis